MQKDELQTTETLTDVAHFQSQESFEKAMQALKNEGILPKEIQGITTLSQAGLLKSASLDGSANVWPDFLAVRYKFLPNSIMYGAARIGNTWKGGRITIKQS